MARRNCPWQNHRVITSTRLAALGVVVAIGAVATYVLLLRLAIVRNHPEGYVVAFALATALAALAVVRARARRWPAWLASVAALFHPLVGRPRSPRRLFGVARG